MTRNKRLRSSFDAVALVLTAAPSLVLCGLLAMFAGSATPAAEAASQPEAAAVAAGIYALDASWTDDRQQPVKLSQYAGHAAFVAMVYTSCQNVCPLIMQKMRTVTQAAAKAGVTADVILITLDPEHDDPAKLAAFKGHLKGSESWRFLIGDMGDTRALANLLSVRFGRDPKTGEISHDNKILFVNGSGVVAATLEGLGADVDDFVAKAKQAAVIVEPTH